MSSRKTESGKIPEEAVDSRGSGEQPRFRTALGERLWTVRQQAIAGGLRLLSDDEIEEEILRRRGELAE